MKMTPAIRQAILDHAARLDKVLPGAVPALVSNLEEKTREVADQAVAGIILFAWNGQTPTRVGRREIDWSGRHHKHQEWPAQLNRFFALVPLAQAYKATGEERYAEAAADYIADWLRAHPPREGWEKAPYDNTLNLSIRVGHLSRSGWMGLLPIFLASPRFDDALVGAMLDSIRVQLAYEMAHMPNTMNWRIAAADCLLAAGLKLGFLPEAETWKGFGVKVLNDAWHRQVLPEGCHYERNPGYHTWMTRVMTGYCNLNRALPELGLIMDPLRVAKMWDYAQAGIRPNDSFSGLHDCASDRTGARSPDRPGDSIRRERERFRREWNLPAAEPLTAYVGTDSGQAMLRTGWGEDDQYVTFDATVWGGGHCHLSRNAVQLHAFRQTMVADPGSLTYEGSDPMSAHGKSTRAHNTCTLNGLNQADTNPQAFYAFHGPDVDFVFGEYNGGYWEGDFRWNFSHMGKGIMASHARWMLWVHDLGLVILDSMYRQPTVRGGDGETPPSLECNWQLAENAVPVAAPDGSRVDVGYGACGLTMLFPYRPAGTMTRIYTGSREPLRGWLPASAGVGPAPQVALETARMERMHDEYLSVLLPWGGGVSRPAVTASVWKSDADRFGRLTLTWADGRTDEFHWAYRLIMMLEANPEFDTDAGLVHVRRGADGKIVRITAVGGTFMKPFLPGTLPAPGILVWNHP